MTKKENAVTSKPYPLLRINTSSSWCDVHGSHRPKPLVSEVHHIWPRGMGGPDGPSNRVRVCPTGHVNIHRAIRDLLAGQRPRGGRNEVKLARQGVAAWVAAGRPGRPE